MNLASVHLNGLQGVERGQDGLREKSGNWGPMEVGERRRKRKKGDGCTDYSGVCTGRKRRAHTICWTVCWAQGVEKLWSPLCGAC